MNFEKIIEKINIAKKIAIFSHTRPDGDTTGGVLALKMSLRSIGKECEVFCDNEIQQKFFMLSEADTYKLKTESKFDLYIAVDCGELARLGANSIVFENNQNTINIDHHTSNTNFAEINYVQNFSSTCEIIYELLNEMKIPLSVDSAKCLYVGLSTDTGNFAHSNTNEHTFECAKNLVKYDVDVSGINYVLYRNSSFARTKLLGKVLSSIRRFDDNKVTLIFTMLSDINEMDADSSSTEGFIDYAINIEGTEVGVSLCQHTENAYKVSMRSRGKIDVNKICMEFGGGGHKNASGCMISGFFEDVVDRIVREISFSL